MKLFKFPASVRPKASAPTAQAGLVAHPGPRRQPLAPDDLEPGARDVRRRLLSNGVSEVLTDRVVRSVVKSRACGAFAIDAAAQILGALFRVQPSPKRGGGPRLIAFVGPTGGGKTTSLAKLGRRLREAGRKVAFASFDRVGASALETVGGVDADVDRAEIPLVAVRNAADVRRLMRRASEVDAVLLDTPSFSPRDDEGLERMARELARIRGKDALDVYLVLPATTGAESLRIASEAFRRMEPTAAVLTKLDETGEPGVALEVLLGAQLPISLLADGQDVRGHLRRPRPDHFADLLLRGRMA